MKWLALGTFLILLEKWHLSLVPYNIPLLALGTFCAGKLFPPLLAATVGSFFGLSWDLLQGTPLGVYSSAYGLFALFLALLDEEERIQTGWLFFGLFYLLSEGGICALWHHSWGCFWHSLLYLPVAYLAYPLHYLFLFPLRSFVWKYSDIPPQADLEALLLFHLTVGRSGLVQPGDDPSLELGGEGSL